MTLDTSLCLSELQPEGAFTNTWKSDHSPAQSPQGPACSCPAHLRAPGLQAPFQLHKGIRFLPASSPLGTVLCLECASSSVLVSAYMLHPPRLHTHLPESHTLPSAYMYRLAVTSLRDCLAAVSLLASKIHVHTESQHSAWRKINVQ